MRTKMVRSMVAGLALYLLPVMGWATNHIPGELIVKYKDGTFRTSDSTRFMYQEAGVEEVSYIDGLGQSVELLYLHADQDMESAMERLSADPSVEYVQPNYILSLPTGAHEISKGDTDWMLVAERPSFIPCIPGMDIPGCDPNEKLPCIVPGFPPGCDGDGGGGGPGDPGNPGNEKPELADAPDEVTPPQVDPNLPWGIKKVQALEAWKQNRGSKEMVVAVIDTGIDYNHEDLSFNVWRNPNPTNGDIAGWDFVHNDGLPFDDHAHGTHTSGSVGGVGGNGKGLSGVSQKVSIMGIKFLSKGGQGSTADAIKAIDYAVKNGAKILSNSWGGPGDSNNSALKESIERANAAGVLFIAAAGNDGNNNDSSFRKAYPASFDNENIIAVAATDENDGKAAFSNYGKVSTDLGAPGVNVESTIPGNKYKAYSGTSMACPHVAGAAALVWSAHPEWTHLQVKEALMETVDAVASLDGKTVTGGRLNVLKAIQYQPK